MKPFSCQQAFTLVGSGRVGTALAKLGTGSDVFSSFLNRSICFPLQNPTLVCNLSSKLKRVNHASCTHAHDGVADCDAIRDVQKVVERGQPVDGPPGPIIVCTRNNDLQGVLDSTPKERREGSLTSSLSSRVVQPRLAVKEGGYAALQILCSSKTVCCNRGWMPVVSAATHRFSNSTSLHTTNMLGSYLPLTDFVVFA